VNVGISKLHVDPRKITALLNAVASIEELQVSEC
jgi:hypothetical protein